MINDVSDSSFVPSGYLAALKDFVPQSRDDYLAHIQKVYNYKLHTPFPLVLHIEPTNECNQACRMCCHPTQKRGKQNIEKEVALMAIEQAAIYKPWATHFFFFGEPFLNKSLFSYIKSAKMHGLRNVSTTTNLTAINDEKIKKIPKSGLDSIHISYEGLNREHYAKVRGKDTFDKATRNILKLIEEREKQNSKLWISLTFVRTTETDDEIDWFKSQWLDLVNSIHVSPQFEYRNGSDDGSRRQAISEMQAKRNDGDLMYTETGDRVPCRQLWTRLVVTSNGEMVPCSQNIDAELSLGNIRTKSIHEAWTSREMQSLRMEHISGDYRSRCGKICEACTDWDWSGRFTNRPKVSPVSQQALIARA